MIKYKYIHKNTGYQTLCSSNDSILIDRISKSIEELEQNFVGVNGEITYAYIYDNNQSIYCKMQNSLVNALIDNDNFLIKNYPNAYSSEIIFNDPLLPINNEEINDYPITPLSYMIPSLMTNELQYVPLIVNSLLLNKKIALIGNNTKQIKNFISFVLHLFPLSFAKKIGYVINLDYIPSNIYLPVFNKINIFGLTNRAGVESLDIVIDLNQRYNFTEQLSSFAKVLEFDCMNIMELNNCSKNLYSLFDANGNYLEQKAKQVLMPMIFEREKNETNANLLLDAMLTSTERIDNRVFNSLADFILNNNLYRDNYAAKIEKLITEKSELYQFKIIFDEVKVKQYLINLVENEKNLNVICNYIISDRTQLTNELQTILNEKKEIPLVYDIIFDIIIKSNNLEKIRYCIDYLRYDRTYNLRINNQRFDDFVLNKIFVVNKKEDDIVKLSTVYLYSIIKYGNTANEDSYAKNRKQSLIDKLNFIDISKKEKINILFKVYYNIANFINEDIPERRDELYNFQLFSRNQIKTIIDLHCKNVKNEEEEFNEIIDCILDNRDAEYHSLYQELINLILYEKSIFESSTFLYEKYFNVNNYKKFDSILVSLGYENKEEYQKFLLSLRQEEIIGSNLSQYRLDYIYNCYSKAPLIVKTKIAKELNLEYNKNTNEKIKNIVYNNMNANNEKNISEQKKVIDYIIKYAEVNDDITSYGKSNQNINIYESLIIAFLLSISSFIIFNIPVFIKMILVKKKFIYLFFEYNNIITPFVLLYSFIVLLITNIVNIHKTRGNKTQALIKTILDWVLFICIPIFVYIIVHLIVYFFM